MNSSIACCAAPIATASSANAEPTLFAIAAADSAAMRARVNANLEAWHRHRDPPWRKPRPSNNNRPKTRRVRKTRRVIHRRVSKAPRRTAALALAAAPRPLCSSGAIVFAALAGRPNRVAIALALADVTSDCVNVIAAPIAIS